MAKWRHAAPSCLFKPGVAEFNSKGRSILFGPRNMPWATGIHCCSVSQHNPNYLPRIPCSVGSAVGRWSTCRAISGLREFTSWPMVLGNVCFFFFSFPKPIWFHLSPFWENPAQRSVHQVSSTGNAGGAAQKSPMLLRVQLLNCFDV